MKKIINCRRSIIALVGIACLTWLGLAKGIDISGISMAISTIVASIAASNAYQNKNVTKDEEGDIGK